MSLEKFIEDFEDAVEDVEPGSLNAGTVYQKIAVWDSLAVLTVIAMLDAEYDVRLKADTLKNCGTLGALFALVDSLPES
ncbi:MAG TPA: acyl carrier protein [Opitutae bacterium]|jgi:acyl carrier protein|nr:acyl carrier protein [Opitutae bacterium]